MSSNPTRDIQTVLRERVVPSGGTRHGLVVGIETYQDARLNLRCARADAQAIYNVMVDPECGMFPEENVRLLVDAEATRENVWRSLAGLRRAAGQDDTVWVYYAGHAAPEESHVYWVTYDADVDDLYATGLANNDIRRVLDEIRARQLIVLLDCCHAAATSVQKNPTRAVLTAKEVFQSYQGKGRITLSSSDGKEKSVELGDVGHGAFTYFLEKGLRGEADRDGDGVVTADKLWSYLRHQVSEASQKAGNRQTPVLMGEMTHDLALTLNPASTRRKKEIADAIEALVGLREDQLTTEEGRFCLEILRRGPQSAEENVIAAELANLREGKLQIATFRLLVRSALEPRPIPEAEPPRTHPEPAATIRPKRPAKAAPTDFVRQPCPACGRALRVPANYAGRTVSCPGCKTPLDVSRDLRQLALAATGGQEPRIVRPERLVIGQGIELVLIPAGEFLMGSPDSDEEAAKDEKPQHRVRITKPFYLGVHPVTQSQYEPLMGTNPSHFKGDGNRPVEGVSWEDANAFCRKLSEAMSAEGGGLECRLPTEAEWEYACRAGTTTRYCFGDDAAGLGQYAWFFENWNRTTHPVGQKKPNAWGLYDVHGNVWEWCQDGYDREYYARCPVEDPVCPSRASLRVLRGGSWGHNARDVRSARRICCAPGYRYNTFGFRLALVPPGK